MCTGFRTIGANNTIVFNHLGIPHANPHVLEDFETKVESKGMKTEQLALQNEWIDCHSTLQASQCEFIDVYT